MALFDCMQKESFFLDFLNKRKKEFLHVLDGEIDRFPVIDKIINFEKSIAKVKIFHRQ